MAPSGHPRRHVGDRHGDYGASSAAVTVDLSTGRGLGGDAEGDTLLAIDNLIGSSFADRLTGDLYANSLVGGAGDDTLQGGGGTDTLVGGSGNDVYLVSGSTDTIVEAAGGGIDEVRTTSSSYTLGAELDKLTFVGAGDFTGIGNVLANTILGGSGHDGLTGAAGDDSLVGGLGNDTLEGGAERTFWTAGRARTRPPTAPARAG